MTTGENTGAETRADLIYCDREPVHLLGRIQPFDCLIAVTADWLVAYASRNTETFTGFAAEKIVGQPLDLSLSELRSVSPVHIEYLRNMGVAASMSISIVRDGELWGLCACHNMTPKLLSSSMRNAAETFGLGSRADPTDQEFQLYDRNVYGRARSSRSGTCARPRPDISVQRDPATSLRELIRKESAAYLADKEHRLHVEGADVRFEPDAIATIPLVVHELVTNSAKYGALSNDVGSVSMNIQTTHQDHVELTWTKQGGPPVTPPDLRGFGSTIIERSIPFQLEGDAVVDFRPEGLHARFKIPLRHVAVAAANEEDEAPKEPAPSSDAPDPARIDLGKVLVVEDNTIIAMDAEHLLLSAGATEVILASHIADARTAICEHAFDFALLDVNLGNETSIPIADELAERGVPFVFATGYGDQVELPDNHRHIVRMGKPFDSKMIVDAIIKTREQRKR